MKKMLNKLIAVLLVAIITPIVIATTDKNLSAEPDKNLSFYVGAGFESNESDSETLETENGTISGTAKSKNKKHIMIGYHINNLVATELKYTQGDVETKAVDETEDYLLTKAKYQDARVSFIIQDNESQNVVLPFLKVGYMYRKVDNYELIDSKSGSGGVVNAVIDATTFNEVSASENLFLSSVGFDFKMPKINVRIRTEIDQDKNTSIGFTSHF